MAYATLIAKMMLWTSAHHCSFLHNRLQVAPDDSFYFAHMVVEEKCQFPSISSHSFKSFMIMHTRNIKDALGVLAWVFPKQVVVSSLGSLSCLLYACFINFLGFPF